MALAPPGRGDRRAQLAEIAADLFRRNGYHAVGVNDIASAAGLTGPALYRHFAGKQEILGYVLRHAIDTLADTVEQAIASPDATPEQRLRAANLAKARLVVGRRDIASLWRWQGRHLSTADQEALRHRGALIRKMWVELVVQLRPTLPRAEADLLFWAADSVFGSIAVHQVSLPKRRFEALLADLAEAVLACDALGTAPAEPASVADASWRAALTVEQSRREQVLLAACRLFRERGFHEVSMADIGAAAGIAGPSVYRHFASKAEILLAGCNRVADQLRLGGERAIERAGDPADALDRLVQSYVDTMADNRDVVSVYIAELPNLPERDRALLIGLQREHVAGWVRLLRLSRPELTEQEARVVVQAALTVANDFTRTGRLLRRPGLLAGLPGLMHTVLTADLT